MALEIVWTKRAEKGYASIIEYLETNFTEREVKKFVRQSNEFFSLLTEYPEILEATTKRKNLHRGPINKFTILTYRIVTSKNQIELINIRSSRKRPLRT